MKAIIGYTDSITECECCGKVDLKGTYCIELDGVELYYGSVCAFKVHGLTDDEQKEAKKQFKKETKLNEILEASKGTEYEKSEIVKFIQKKGLDLNAFVVKHGELYEDALYYKAYKYGYKIYLIEK